MIFSVSYVCSLKPKSTSHYILSSHLLEVERQICLIENKEIDANLVNENKIKLHQILFYGSGTYIR